MFHPPLERPTHDSTDMSISNPRLLRRPTIQGVVFEGLAAAHLAYDIVAGGAIPASWK